MKKILILIILLLMTVQFNAVYAEEPAKTLPDSPDMTFAVSLGIIEEGTDQTSPLTRIELAAVFYNIMMSNIEPYMDYSKYFSDVGFDMASYSDFVYQCGIMNGVGDGLFEPDSNVTYAQLIKTVVAFLGYSELAEEKGGYPYGYIAVAQTLGLIDSMPPSINSVITVNKMASVLRLATNVPLMQRITFGTDEIKYEITENSDYLGEYMDITRIRGVVTANYLTDLEGNDELEYGQVKIEDELFYITELSDGIINNLGCEVDIYAKAYEKSQTSSIMYYELNDSNDVIVIDGDDIKELSSNKIEYYDNEKDKNARISSDTKVIYNGTLASSYDNSTINPFKDSYLEGTVKCIDNDNDGINEVIVVDAYSSYIVKNIVNNVIFNEIRPEETVDLGASFKDGDIEITNVIGQPIMLSEIEEGDIINVSRDTDERVKRIVVTIDTFTGILKGINESENIIDIDGHEFEFSKNLISNPKSDYADIKLGTKVTLYFNKDGKVSDIKAFDAKYKTGYLVGAKKSKGIEDSWEMRIFSSSGEFEDLYLAEKVRVGSDGKIMAEDVIEKVYVEVDELDPETGDFTGNRIAKLERQVVLYNVDEEGKIIWMDFAEGTEIRNGLYKMAGFDGTNPKSLYYRSSQKNFGAELLLSSSTVIFNVPPENDADNWSRYYVETSSYYSNDGNYTTDFIAYSTDENGSPCAEIIVEYDGTKQISATADAFVIDKVSEIIDADGEDKIKISGYLYGTLTTYYGDISEVKDSLYGETLKRGDIIRINAIDGDIKSITKVFDFSTETFLTLGTNAETGEPQYVAGSNPTQSSYYSSFRCTYGEVVYNDGNYIKVKPEESDVEQVYPLANFKIVEIDFSDDEKGVMRTSSSTRVFDTQNYPGYSSKVVIQTRNGDARTLVLYNGLGGVN